jgi:hypothetical protein
MKLFVTFLFLFSTASFAAENKVGLALGMAQVEEESVHSIALDYQYLFEGATLGSGVLKIGPGVRYTRISSDKFAIYKDDEYLENMAVNAFNLALYTEYALKKIVFGFNIDLFGFSTGSVSDIKGTNDDTSPANQNLFQGGSADQGTLNSEFWAGYRADQWLFRGGIAHFVTEYKGDNPEGDKRQRFFNSLFLGAAFYF